MAESTNDRLKRYATEYAWQAWGQNVDPTDEDALIMDVRSDGYANAHVEGEHEGFRSCGFTSARECGERMAAAEWVECS